MNIVKNWMSIDYVNTHTLGYIAPTKHQQTIKSSSFKVVQSDNQLKL